MAQLMLVNPSGRKRRKTRARTKTRARAKTRTRRHHTRAAKRHHVARRSNPVRMHRRRKYRTNPIGGSIRNIINDVLKPGAIAALGALGLDVIWGYLPIPASISASPMMAGLAKGAGAIGVGMLAGKMLGGKTGHLVALGGLTVVLHSLLRDQLATMMPNIMLGDVGYYGPSMLTTNAVPQLGMYAPDRPSTYSTMGAYDTSSIDF